MPSYLDHFELLILAAKIKSYTAIIQILRSVRG